jgi:DNA repair exonuclease SbcCD nuclease subunit
MGDIRNRSQKSAPLPSRLKDIRRIPCYQTFRVHNRLQPQSSHIPETLWNLRKRPARSLRAPPIIHCTTGDATMLKLLHTSDWEIGRSYGRFESEDAAALAAARIEGVKRIAQIANEYQVDAVMLAGDVFDSQTPRDKTVARLFEALAGFNGPWLMLPGNHDAALPESVWEFAKRMDGVVPANCMLCLQPVPVEVTGRNGTPFVVLPAPLTQRHTHTDLSDWFDQAQTAVGLPRIGLAHGSVEGILAEDVDSANPIAADRAERARLDYLALGDWHGTFRNCAVSSGRENRVHSLEALEYA